jgi:hypothetical protein
MRIHLIKPSEVSFGTAVITPRLLYVLAAATPKILGDPYLVDETLAAVNPVQIENGDIVGIGIHTANALRGYEIGTIARARGAYVVFGGIHATLYPNEAHELGGAHAGQGGCCHTDRNRDNTQESSLTGAPRIAINVQSISIPGERSAKPWIAKQKLLKELYEDSGCQFWFSWRRSPRRHRCPRPPLKSDHPI